MGHSLFFKVLRDTRSAAAVALELGDEQMVREQKESWRKRAHAYLRAAAEEKGEDQVKTRRRYRVKTLEWLLAANHSLEVMTGLTFEAFMVPEGEVPPSPSPVCGLQPAAGCSSLFAACCGLLEAAAATGR